MEKLCLGVFSIDSFPDKVPEKHFFICNTAPSEHPGLHWFVVYRNELGNVEIFDSRVIKGSELRPIRTILKKKKLEANYYPLMPRDSNKCGEYCIYFIVNRVLNQRDDFIDILNEYFSRSLPENESRVNNFISRIRQDECFRE